MRSSWPPSAGIQWPWASLLTTSIHLDGGSVGYAASNRSQASLPVPSIMSPS
jgi:hypothetical protein